MLFLENEARQAPLVRREGQGARHSLTPGDPNNYLLFAVMVHAGSAYGGHYYAFVKSINKEGKVRHGVARCLYCREPRIGWGVKGG